MPLFNPPASTGYTPGGTDVAVADGGTGASNAAGARANLGVEAAGAAAALLTSSISDGDTTHAPDGNSVFDALAGKQDALTFTGTGDTVRKTSPTLVTPIVDKLTATQGAITTSQPALDHTATWNAGGVTFTNLKSNVTDTASAAASLLADLQVGGASKFRVDKTGAVYHLGSYTLQYSGVNDLIAISTSGTMSGRTNAAIKWQFVTADGAESLRVMSTFALQFNSTASLSGGALDTTLSRNAANILQAGTTSANALGAMLGGRVVVAKTSNYPIVAATDNSKFFTNTGAGAGVNFTLPTAVAGLTFEFYRDADQTVTITAGASTTIRVGASVTTAAGNVTLDVVGSRIRLVAISATQWVGDLSGTAAFT
jgi:hypothetical protein